MRTPVERTASSFLMVRAVWAISVFVALDDVGAGSAPTILRTKLRSYARVYMPTVGPLREAGLGLLATFARPHFSAVMPGLGSAEDLLAALGELQINPYAGGEPGQPT